MGRPTIDVVFKQLANTAIARSARGIVVLVIRDETNTTFETLELNFLSDLKSEMFSPDNLDLIKDCFFGGPSKVIIIRVDEDGELQTALSIASGLSFDYIGCTFSQADQTVLSNWIKEQAQLKKTFKGITWGTTLADHECVINLCNLKVKFADNRGEQSGEKYIPSLLGILAGLPLNKSATYFKCSNLVSVTEPLDIDLKINEGNLVLFKDEGFVKIAAGVNTLVTLSANKFEDMKQIGFVEAMHIIVKDIKSTFKEWVGNYKNKYDNQVLFITSVRAYFKTLEGADVLDNQYQNTVDVNVTAQRLAWQSIGKDTSLWDDQQVKNNSYKRSVFLLGDIKILGAIENLALDLNLF